MGLAEGNSGIAMGYVGTKKVVAGYVGTKKVFDAGQITLSGAVTSFKPEVTAPSRLYSVSGSAGDTGTYQVYFTAASGYEFATGTYSVIGQSASNGDTSYALSENNTVLTFTQSYTIPDDDETDNWGWSGPDLIRQDVSGTITYVQPPNTILSGHTTSYTAKPETTQTVTGTLTATGDYDYDGEDSTTFSETFTVPDEGGAVEIDLNDYAPTKKEYSGIITYNVDSNVTFSITPLSYTGSSGQTINWSGTLFANGERRFESNDLSSISVSGSFTVPSGGGNVSVDLTSYTTYLTYSGTITYSTPDNTSPDTGELGLSPTSYSGLGVGDTITYNGAVNADTGYAFVGNPNQTSKIYTGTTTVPSGGGDITVSVGSDSDVAPVYIGFFEYTRASNVQLGDSYTNSYGPEFAGESVSYSVDIEAAQHHTFDDDDSTEKTITGTATVPSGGGNISIDLSSYTVSATNTISVNPSELSIIGAGGTATFSIDQTGEDAPTVTGVPDWLSHGTIDENTISVTFTAEANGTTNTRTATINFSKPGTDVETITIQQSAGSQTGSLTGVFDFTEGVASTQTIVVKSNGNWNISFPGVEGVTVDSATGSSTPPAGQTVTVSYDGSSQTFAGFGDAMELRAGNTVGSGVLLDSLGILFFG